MSKVFDKWFKNFITEEHYCSDMSEAAFEAGRRAERKDVLKAVRKNCGCGDCEDFLVDVYAKANNGG